MTPMMLPMSLGGLLRHTRTLLNIREVVPLSPYKTKAKRVADALISLEKGEAAAIFQLRCGHCPLKKFLKRIGAKEDDRCETCHAKETPAHFLNYCRKYSAQRRDFRKKLKDEEIKANTNSAYALLDSPEVYPYLAGYIHATGRFLHLDKYLDR